MSILSILVDTVTRAAHAFALAIAPPLFAPEPGPGSITGALVAAIVLAVVVFGALRLAARVRSPEARIAAAALVLSVVVSLVVGAYFRGPRAPLGRGVLFVAVPLWAGLAACAAIVAPRRNARLVASAVVALGLVLFGASAEWLFSTPQMWWQTVLRDGDERRALDVITEPQVRARDHAAALAVVDRCLTLKPASCACGSRRAFVVLHLRDMPRALEAAQVAAGRCPADPLAQAALAATLATNGEGKRAEEVARAALVDTSEPLLDYALALALDQQGRTAEAVASARRAFEGGAGRDAAVLLGALLIRENDLDGAEKVLAPIPKEAPNDAEALFDLAIVADKKNDYNRARERYLAALRADPSLTAARRNLALLTLRFGILEEAKHHARKLVEATPGDARSVELLHRIELAALERSAPRPTPAPAP
ncbi:tetratricopeptide repeat protein [Polyangium mundeleinium]|uniref:Tetratricopeptide repeat protein n=1 Tax=Polyangium mundeleinium TaxID=2995306 RepID=A0ABT5ERF7_9BACT|nr:tetratricopeptide repeat protein [Polyangium mundeleinium]MDC0744351.1 tetratricopeptide repeat protein [Polyangium mundeleinium]